MVADARSRTKVYLETNITESNITKDDGSTYANWMVCYGKPEYPMTKVFTEKAVDLIFSIGEPESTPLVDSDQEPYGYEESVPIETYCIDKPGITGTKLKWTAEAELRLVCESNPTGSQRALERRGDNDVALGSTVLYSTRFVLNYRRDTTT